MSALPVDETGRATGALGIELRHGHAYRHGRTSDSLPDRLDIAELLLPGLRKNPRRAHLLVSTVLGKHLPTDPLVVRDSGNRLGDLVRAVLGERDAVVLGFAETATGLGHCVAARIEAACYLHSTRRVVDGADTLTGFEEGHSHATSHLLQPVPPGVFTPGLPLVLVDDEISTGNTALDAITALHEFAPRTHYVLATLVDMRTDADRDRFAAVAAGLGARIDTVCLAAGSTVLPEGLAATVAALPECELNPVGRARGTVTRLELPWPREVPDGGRHGFLRTDIAAFEQAATAAGKLLRDQLATEYAGRPVIVLGHEELMYLPLRLAVGLAEAGLPVRYQTTTRSPAYVLDEPGYPLRRGFRFRAPEAGQDQPRYLYNARWPRQYDAPGAAGPGPGGDAAADPVLVFVVDEPGDSAELGAPGGLLDVLTTAGSDVLVAVLPGADPRALAAARNGNSKPEPLYGPEFGSYAREDVAWLLKDLSGANLEADIAEREQRIQAGVAHYAESLPIEYQ
ncbi:phosphoribosyltransferase domain-containing protein, partial [Nocardia sp. NPDC003345]